MHAAWVIPAFASPHTVALRAFARNPGRMRPGLHRRSTHSHKRPAPMSLHRLLCADQSHRVPAWRTFDRSQTASSIDLTVNIKLFIINLLQALFSTGHEACNRLKRIALRGNAPILVQRSWCSDYCGPVGVLWFELGGSAVGVALCEVVGSDVARGASGTVVMALSGFSR